MQILKQIRAAIREKSKNQKSSRRNDDSNDNRHRVIASHTHLLSVTKIAFWEKRDIHGFDI